MSDSDRIAKLEEQLAELKAANSQPPVTVVGYDMSGLLTGVAVLGAISLIFILLHFFTLPT